MSQELGLNVELPLPFGDAVTGVREALKREGFGVLTEIDLRAAFREKLSRELRPCTILGLDDWRKGEGLASKVA